MKEQNKDSTIPGLVRMAGSIANPKTSDNISIVVFADVNGSFTNDPSHKYLTSSFPSCSNEFKSLFCRTPPKLGHIHNMPLTSAREIIFAFVYDNNVLSPKAAQVAINEIAEQAYYKSKHLHISNGPDTEEILKIYSNVSSRRNIKIFLYG